jgi:hypothetical protein
MSETVSEAGLSLVWILNYKNELKILYSKLQG